MIIPWHTGIPHSEDPCWNCRYLSFSLVWAPIPRSIHPANRIVCAHANTEVHRYEHIPPRILLLASCLAWRILNERADRLRTQPPATHQKQDVQILWVRRGCATCWELVSWSSILPMILRQITKKKPTAQETDLLRYRYIAVSLVFSFPRAPTCTSYMMIIYSH